MVQEICFRNSPLTALVDDEDFDLVMDSPTRWRARAYRRKDGSPLYYVERGHVNTRGVIRERLPYLLMHRLILAAPEHLYVDHVNGNGLDNRRCNLRLATNSLNQANRQYKRRGTSSQFKGVTWNRASGKWQAGIKVRGRSIHLGLFEKELDAAQAYNRAALDLFGEFAFVNALEAA